MRLAVDVDFSVACCVFGLWGRLVVDVCFVGASRTGFLIYEDLAWLILFFVEGDSVFWFTGTSCGVCLIYPNVLFYWLTEASRGCLLCGGVSRWNFVFWGPRVGVFDFFDGILCHWFMTGR